MNKKRPNKYLTELSHANRNLIKTSIKNKETNFEQLMNNENLIKTETLLKITTESILYSCTYNNVKILNEVKCFIENNGLNNQEECKSKGLLSDTIYLHSAIHNKSNEALNFLLNNQEYNEEKIKDACVIAVKFSNMDGFEKLYSYGKEHFDMNLTFNNKVCMRLAINNRDLNIIQFLSKNGISPFTTNKHLLDIIKRDDEEWLNFYLDNNMIKKDHLINNNINVLHTLMLFNIGRREKYEKGFFYAEKIMDYFVNKENNVKELVAIFKSIPIYYPQSEGKIIEFKDKLKATILYKHMNEKLMTSSLVNNAKKKKNLKE